MTNGFDSSALNCLRRSDCETKGSDCGALIGRGLRRSDWPRAEPSATCASPSSAHRGTTKRKSITSTSRSALRVCRLFEVCASCLSSLRVCETANVACCWSARAIASSATPGTLRQQIPDGTSPVSATAPC